MLPPIPFWREFRFCISAGNRNGPKGVTCGHGRARYHTSLCEAASVTVAARGRTVCRVRHPQTTVLCPPLSEPDRGHPHIGQEARNLPGDSGIVCYPFGAWIWAAFLNKFSNLSLTVWQKGTLYLNPNLAHPNR